MDEAVDGADVIMMLRVQFERMNESFFPSIREYFRYYGLTRSKVERAKPDAIIMHPGPINRGVEIATDVADGPYSVILDQVSAGVAVRMAILYLLLGGQSRICLSRTAGSSIPRRKIDAITDVLIRDGKIRSIGKIDIADMPAVSTRAGLIVAPGFFDIHVHLREPGTEEAETIATGGSAAVAGGFVAVAAMPNTKPPNDNPSITSYIISEARRSSPALVFPIGAITKEQKGETLAEIGEMVEAGIVGDFRRRQTRHGRPAVPACPGIRATVRSARHSALRRPESFQGRRDARRRLFGTPRPEGNSLGRRRHHGVPRPDSC